MDHFFGERRMIRKMFVLAGMAVVFGVGAPAMAGGCKGCDKVAKAGDGFCCGKGKAFGVELTSKKLHDALAGKKMDAYGVECAGCKSALKTNGKCDHCKVAAADGKMYHSMVAHAIAKGKPYTAEKAAHCGSCKTAFGADGFCTGCNAGFVAGRMFTDKESYDGAKTALMTLVKAVATSQKCATCAVAMVTDGTCSHCKASFKDGKKVG